MEFWNRSTFCLVTGASRGIGKSVAIEFAKSVGPGSVLLLLARSVPALEETKLAVQATAQQNVQVVTGGTDFGTPDALAYFNLITAALDSSGKTAQDFESSILVHNAASLGNVALRSSQMQDLAELRSYFDLNLHSLILLNSQFMKVFNDTSKERTLVQMSSLGALRPFKTWSVYCVAKAARDMVLKCVAEEEPTISTLSYGPGPVDTDMYAEGIQLTSDPGTAAAFGEVKTSGQLLAPATTARKLVRILGERKYTKGEHIDFTDIE